MIAAGWTPKAVQQVLGHRSVSFTLDTYGHLFETDLDDFAARLDDPHIAQRNLTSWKAARSSTRSNAQNAC
jgi:hypothetical protein